MEISERGFTEFAGNLDAEETAVDAGLTPGEFAGKLDAERGAEGRTGLTEEERERRRAALERELERRRLNGQGEGSPVETGSVAGAYVRGLVKGAAEGFAKGGAKAAKELATPFAGLVTGAARLVGTPVRMLGWDGITKAADAADAAWANWGADALDLGYSDALTAVGDAGGKVAGISGTVLGFMTPGAAVKAAKIVKGAAAAKTVARAAEWTLPAMMGNDAAVRTYDLAKSRGQGDARALTEAAADGAIHFIGFRLFANKAIDRWLKIPELKEAALPKIIQAAPQMNVKTFGELVRAVRNGSVRQAVAARAAGAVKAGGIMGAQSFLSSIAGQYADEGEGNPDGQGDLADKLAVALRAGAHGVGEGALMEGVLGAGEVALTMREAREATAGAVRAMLKVERGRDFVRRQNPERVRAVAEVARAGGRATAEQLDLAGLPPDMDPREVRRLAFDLKRDAEREGDRAAALAMDGVRLKVSDDGSIAADGVDGLRIEKVESLGGDGGTSIRMRVSGIGAESADTAAKRAALAEALERAVAASGGREFTFADAEAKEIAVAAMRERASMLERWSKDAEADSLAERAQGLADRMFGRDGGVLVRRGTRAEAERAARAALGADAPLKLIRGGAEDVLGMWDRRRHELVLFDGATEKTVAHELGGHALRQWAEANSPDLLRRIDDYARECPEALRREIEALYPDFRDRGDAMLDEIFANRLERELGGRFAGLLESSPAALGWWQGLKRMLAEAWHGFARAFGGRVQGFDAKELDGLTPAQAMERIVERIGRGERLDGGFGGGRADGGENGMRLSVANVGGREIGVVEAEPLTTREAKDRAKVREVLSEVVGKEFEQRGEMKLVKVDGAFPDYFWNSNSSQSLRRVDKLWRAKVSAVPILGDILRTTPLGPAEAARHISKSFKERATFYRCQTRFGIKRQDGIAVYPCDLLVMEMKDSGKRYVYDIVRMMKPSLTAKGDLSKEVVSQLYERHLTGERLSTPRIVPNRADGRNGGGGELRPSRRRGEYMARESARALEAIERSGVEREDEAVERSVSELERHAAGDRTAPEGLDYGGGRTLSAESRGGLRIADEGERRNREAEDVAANPGATASKELLAAERAAPAPRDDEAVARPVAFSMSQMVRLYQALRQSASLPRVLQDAKRRGAKWVARITAGSDVELNPEAFGIVDRSDLMALKDQLRRQGHFKNEDAEWSMRHTKDECETERTESEWMLQDAMRNLAEARVRGDAPGGARAVTGAMAHEIGNLVAEMPMGEGLRRAAGGDSPLVALRRIYDGLKGDLSGTGLREFERQGLADAVAWWSGADRTEGEWQRALRRGGAAAEAEMLRAVESERARIAADADGMAREAIGMFLSAPEALKAMCPWAYNRIVERISSSEGLARAYGSIAAGNAPEEVMGKIREQWTHDAEVELRKYEAEVDRPLGTKWQRAKRRILLNLHGMEAPVVSVLSDAGAQRVAAARKALKAARRRGDADDVRRMERMLKETRDEVRVELRELSMGVLKRQRGAGQDRDYLLGITNRVFGDMLRDGVSIDDLRTYMKAQRTIELQGRADSFGITPREARRALDAMRERLGDDGYAKVEDAQRRFMDERQRAILGSEDVRRAFGDALVSYWRSNTHYARSERVLSAGQVREYEALRREWAEGHPGKVDVLADIERLMERHRFGQGATDGSTFVKPLQGSMKATADPLAYTIANDLRILAFARRNALVMQVAELAGRIGAQGFATVDDAATVRHLEDSRRYGTVAYLEDGKRRLLVMPKVAAEGLKGMGEPELAGLVRANRLVSAALTQFNPRFAWRNIIKNRASAEINVPWMREARYVTAMRFLGLAGPARLAEHLAERVMVRLPDAAARSVAANLLWGERSNMYWIAQATRIAKMMLEPNGIREMAEAADEAWRNGETARAQTIVDDLRIARDMMRKPIFAGKWRMATGRTDMADIDAVFAALDYRTNYGGVRLDGLKAAARRLKDTARQVAKFNDLEEYRQKIAVELAAERMRNNAAARGEEWKYSRADVDYISATMAGSPRYEMRGRWMNMLEAVPCGPFTNVAMKGAQRTLESIGMDPAAWWTKAATRISGRLATIALFGANGYALVAAMARRMFGDDEEAQKVVDGFENCCGRIARARACVSDYRLKNYDIVPIGMYGKWGSFGINMPRGDEDTMVMPFTDMAARALLTTGQARRMGLSDPIDGAYTMPEAVYQTAVNSGMLPDLQKGSMIWNLGKDMLYAWFQNPYNGFTQRTVYDKTLWDERFERSGEFFAATLKQAWNDVGGQIVMPASTWAEDEGEVPDEGRWVIGMADPKGAAEMPVGGKTIFRALHYVPFGSSIASGLFYFSVDGDRKIAQRLARMQAGEKAHRDGVAMKCVDLIMRQGTVTADYSKMLDEEVERNGWDASDRALIEQSIVRKVKAYAKKESKEMTPIAEVIGRKQSDRERENARAYLKGIGWEPDGAE